MTLDSKDGYGSPHPAIWPKNAGSMQEDFAASLASRPPYYKLGRKEKKKRKKKAHLTINNLAFLTNDLWENFPTNYT